MEKRLREKRRETKEEGKVRGRKRKGGTTLEGK